MNFDAFHPFTTSKTDDRTLFFFGARCKRGRHLYTTTVPSCCIPASYCHLSATLQTISIIVVNLQDNGAVFRIFIALLKSSFDSPSYIAWLVVCAVVSLFSRNIFRWNVFQCVGAYAVGDAKINVMVRSTGPKKFLEWGHESGVCPGGRGTRWMKRCLASENISKVVNLVSILVLRGNGTKCKLALVGLILTDPMDRIPSWEANRFSANRDFPRILWHPKVRYRHLSPSLSKIYSFHTPTSHFLNIILPSTPRSFKWYLTLRFSHQNPTLYVLHAPPISIWLNTLYLEVHTHTYTSWCV